MKSWRPPFRDPERILLAGIESTGKSSAILSIARRCPASTFYIIDNDNSITRLLATEYSDLTMQAEYMYGLDNPDTEYVSEDGNLVVYHCKGWEQNVEALDHAIGQAQPNDWITVDTISALWSGVTKWYTEEMYGNRMDRYLLTKRKEFEEVKADYDKRKAQGKGGRKDKKPAMGGSLEGWNDYGVINPIFEERVRNFLKYPPCHVLVTSEIKSTSKDDDPAVKKMFGPFGVKPEGQKRGGHDVHTVLWVQRSRQGKHTLTTIKDRGRPDMLDSEFDDFAKDYLYKKAGWRAKEV